MLYTLAGVDREQFSRFPMPRNTAVFAPTFRGEGVVRSDDITADPRYGKSAPHHGLPEGHLAVRSYLAVPVKSRTGAILGGLFFGHSQRGKFGPESESIATGIAAQAAIAFDNASLFQETRLSGEALRLANAHLIRLNEDLNQFAYSASHDLREPMRMVSLYSQALDRSLKDKLSSKERQYVDYVLRGAARMEALVADLLAYTQSAELGEAEIPLSDANEALDQALTGLSAMIAESNARISRGTLPQLRIAASQLAHVFQNLIANALKYRRDVVPAIHIASEQRNGEWLVSVSDNGIGIEEQYKEQIFGIFRRLHTEEEYDGTGNGLAICQRSIQRAGGRIWVETVFGEGYVCYLTLPSSD
jgi:signal transduction histidine kinase